MTVQLNHTILDVRDAEASAAHLSEMLDLAPPTTFGPFIVVTLDNGASLDFLTTGMEYDIGIQHYAFLVSEEEWDAIFGRIQAKGLDYWAGPHLDEPGQINHHDGGRGVYWKEPSGHLLEIITVPYGGWPAAD
jgi:catechol 2,3-dioxygenase-like lactoylglutathione lyase family enzyme